MLIQHHVKYKELHGVDEIVVMTQSEHVKLHKKLRRENKCNVPVDELHKISITAHHRTKKYELNRTAYENTEKCKLIRTEYQNSEKCKLIKAAYAKTEKMKQYRAEYQKTEKMKQYIAEYKKRYISSHEFCDAMMPYVKHLELIVYNSATGHPTCTCIFQATSGKKLLFIDI